MGEVNTEAKVKIFHIDESFVLGQGFRKARNTKFQNLGGYLYQYIRT